MYSKFSTLFIIFLCFSFAQRDAVIQMPKGSGIAFFEMLDLKNSGLKAKEGNDSWGWTDPLMGKEYAIMGLNSKTSFVDISNPHKPIHVADIKTQTYNSTWRDIKVYQNHAYIVSEAFRHGLQVFDLTRLRDLENTPAILTPDVHYNKFSNAHNIAINEETGFAYVVGTNTCDGGLHIVDIREPKNPEFITCVGRGIYEVPKNNLHGDSYTHDVQCVIYRGPDQRFFEREICFSSNENTINIVDVTDKTKPVQIGVTTYNDVAYTHQGWLSEDHSIFFLGDELDEQRKGFKTRTYIWDVSDLTKPQMKTYYEAKTRAIDHNMYTHNGLIYQANYDAGLRVLDYSRAHEGILEEVAYLDTMPSSDRAIFEGVWSVYPYFESGIIVVSGIDGVLYLTRLQ